MNIKINEEFKINHAIPGSSDGETVTIQIRRNSDGYYWDFDNEEWSASSKSGTMDYDYSIFWNASFTPSTDSDSHNVSITWGIYTYSQVLTSVGSEPESGASSDMLTSVSNVKSFLDISNTSDDTLIQNIIYRVTDQIQSYCRRDFFSTEYTEYYDGDGSKTLIVNQFPITAIDSIYDDIDYQWGSDDEISSDDIIFNANSNDSKSGIINLDTDYFSIGKQNIKITYTAGYSTIPYDIEKAAILLSAIEYFTGKTFMNANSEGGNSNPEDLKTNAFDILDLYMRVK